MTKRILPQKLHSFRGILLPILCLLVPISHTDAQDLERTRKSMALILSDPLYVKLNKDVTWGKDEFGQVSLPDESYSHPEGIFGMSDLTILPPIDRPPIILFTVSVARTFVFWMKSTYLLGSNASKMLSRF